MNNAKEKENEGNVQTKTGSWPEIRGIEEDSDDEGNEESNKERSSSSDENK
jgi:hypothetical protein